MAQAADLVRAILGERCASDEQAIRFLDTALELEVDPLDFFSHRFSLTEAVVFEHAAAWAKLAFFETVPAEVRGGPQVTRLDSLGQSRSIRATVFDRDVTFCAPRFNEFLRLRERLTPELRDRLCVVPPGEIRARLADLSQLILLEESRQRLARRWPFASASFDLPLGARIAFVAVLALLVGIAATAPFAFKPLLLPPLAVLLVVPALLRLAASLGLAGREPAPPLLTDAELPVYSVLVPLRDEANMVPLLERAMGAIDYPVLWR